MRTVVSAEGAIVREETLDPDVCACCPTSVVRTARGLLVAYRGHTPGNIRDISTIRLENGRWSAPKNIYPDRWKLDACPVNAASVAAKGDNVAVAWYTAAGDQRVEMAFSADGGTTFGNPAVELRVRPLVIRRFVMDGRVQRPWFRGLNAAADWPAYSYVTLRPRVLPAAAPPNTGLRRVNTRPWAIRAWCAPAARRGSRGAMRTRARRCRLPF